MKNNYGILSFGHFERFFRVTKEHSFCSTRKEILPVLSVLCEKLVNKNCVNPSWRSSLETFFSEVEWTWPNFLRYIKLFYQSGRIEDREFGSLVENQVWDMLVDIECQKEKELWRSNTSKYTMADGIPLDLKIYKYLFEFFNRMADEDSFPLRISTHRTKWLINKIMGAIVVFSSENILRSKDYLTYKEYLNTISVKIAELWESKNVGQLIEQVRSQLICDVIEEGVILASHGSDNQGSASSLSEYWVQLHSDKIKFTILDKTAEYYISHKLSIMDTSKVQNIKKNSEWITEFNHSLKLHEPDLRYKITLKLNTLEEVKNWQSKLQKAKSNFENQITELEAELNKLDEFLSSSHDSASKSSSFNFGKMDKQSSFRDRLKKVQEHRRKSLLQLTVGSTIPSNLEKLYSVNEKDNVEEVFSKASTMETPSKNNCYCCFCRGDIIRDMDGKLIPPPKPPRRSLKPHKIV